MPHLDAAYNLARWLSRSNPDAEDIVQEAMLRAYRFFGGYRGDTARAWLLAIVRNTCFTWMKDRRDSISSVPLEEDTDGAGEAALDAGSNDANPEVLLARLEDTRLLDGALENLPIEYREVLVLRELEDLSYREIAQIANIPIGTVMSRLSRARKLLSKRLAASGKELGYGL